MSILGTMIQSHLSPSLGRVAATLTRVPGSSDAFERGFVTYSNEARTEMLGIPAALIADPGAVSEPVAIAMAEVTLANSRAALAVSVTGVAGPGGGAAEKPVGLVHLAATKPDGTVLHRKLMTGDIGRSGIRRASVAEALRMLRGMME